MKFPIFLLNCSIALALLATACKKSSSSENSSSRTSLITSGVWKYDTSGIDFDKNGTIDYGDTTIAACYRDNTYQFDKDSTGVVNNGTIKCDDSEQASFSFTWSFLGSDQSKIQSNADPLLVNGVNIYSLSSTKLVLYKDTTYLGMDLWYILSLKH